MSFQASVYSSLVSLQFYTSRFDLPPVNTQHTTQSAEIIESVSFVSLSAFSLSPDPLFFSSKVQNNSHIIKHSGLPIAWLKANTASMEADRWHLRTPGDRLHTNALLLKWQNWTISQAGQQVCGLWGETTCNIHQEGKFRGNILKRGNEQRGFEMQRRLR